MVVLDNQPKVVSSTHMNYERLKDALRAATHDVGLISDLADIKKFVTRVTLGNVELSDTGVRWHGNEVHNVIAERLIQMLRAGQDLVPLATFLDRVMLNPVLDVREDLYAWLESGNQPITPDGKILAFKKVRADYMDAHSGTFDNHIGQQPTEDRTRVDTNRNNECSRGLHFCAFGYLAHYSGGSGSHVMIVEVDPADVMAIPTDYNRQKGRTWTYKVIGEVPEETVASFFEGSPVVQPYVEDNNDDDGFIDDDGVYVSFDGDEEDYQFSDDEEVVCLDREDGGYEYDLTEGATYTLIYGTDSDGDVFLEGDDGLGDYYPATLFSNQIARAFPATPEVQVEAEDYTSAEVDSAKPVLMFTHGLKSILSTELTTLVENHGQRGTAELIGVPRTTIQGWLKAIDNQ
jgi:hypothetical protein